jgi:predicted ArsR family transcriptional regulator
MGRGLVTEPELLWVLDSLEEAPTSRDVAECLPIDRIAVHLRLQHLKKEGYLDAEQEGGVYHWSLTERGTESLTDGDLPPADTTDFSAYFADRTNTLNPVNVLAAVARQDNEWVRVSAAAEQFDFSNAAVRKRLKALKADGFVDEDDQHNAHRWRITEAGHERLADAEEALTAEAGTDR